MRALRGMRRARTFSSKSNVRILGVINAARGFLFSNFRMEVFVRLRSAPAQVASLLVHASPKGFLPCWHAAPDRIVRSHGVRP